MGGLDRGTGCNPLSTTRDDPCFVACLSAGQPLTTGVGNRGSDMEVGGSLPQPASHLLFGGELHEDSVLTRQTSREDRAKVTDTQPLALTGWFWWGGWCMLLFPNRPFKAPPLKIWAGAETESKGGEILGM